jgi:hypothetical protein
LSACFLGRHFSATGFLNLVLLELKFLKNVLKKPLFDIIIIIVAALPLKPIFNIVSAAGASFV